jgi:hypothetical protein
MQRILPAALAIGAVILSGAVHGYWTGRWEAPSGPQVGPAGARLDAVALQLGDWEGVALERNQPPVPGIDGVLYRRYVHQLSGQAVTVFLVCGKAGPVATHSPDSCYAANGFQVQNPSRYTLTTPAAEFKTARMVKKKASEETKLRIFWSWSANGAWTAPNDARLPFARQTALYKLYLIRELTRPGETLEEDPSIDLMRQLLPELQRGLFSGA